MRGHFAMALPRFCRGVPPPCGCILGVVHEPNCQHIKEIDAIMISSGPHNPSLDAQPPENRPLELRQKIRSYIKTRNLVELAFIFFACSFFFAPFEKLYKYAFYVSGILFIFAVYKTELMQISRLWVFRFCSMWLAYLTFSLFWTSEVQMRAIDDAVRGLVLVNLFFLVTTYLAQQDFGFYRRLFISLSYVSAVTAAISIVIFFSVSEAGSDRLVHFGVLDHSISAAFCYGVVALITLYGLKQENGAANRHRRWRYYSALAVMFLFVFLTATRGALLGLACAIAVGSIMTGKRWAVLWIAAVSMAVIAAGSMLEYRPYQFLARGSSHRLELWSIVWDRIGDHFWFGSGIGADESMVLSNGYVINHAHQLFLGNHFYGGVPASVLLLSTLAMAGRVAYRKFLKSGDVLCTTLLVYVVVLGLADFGEFLRSPNLIWFYFWFPLALIAANEVSMDVEQHGFPHRRVEAVGSS